MCFGGGSAPAPQVNPASYSLDNSQSAVSETVQPATQEEMDALNNQAPKPATVPLRTQQSGISFEQG